MYRSAFIAPLGVPLLAHAHAHVELGSCVRVRRRPRFNVHGRGTPTRASAAGAGAQSGAWRPRDRDREGGDAGSSRQNDATLSSPRQADAEDANDDADTTAAVEPVMFSSSNPAALQVDDGTLSENPNEVVPIPRRLVRRKSRPTLAEARRKMMARQLNRGVLGFVVLMLLFGVWYASNAVFNVYNKQVLRVFPYPLTCTVVQFAVGAAMMASLWGVRAKRAPSPTGALVACVAPLAICHAAGFLLTNMALGKVSVAFTHTVKATEPFFSAALTPSILGDVPTWGIIGSLVPIVGGVAIASATDSSFNWVGFLCAVGSNVALQSRNVLSKKLMKDQGDLNIQQSPERIKALDSLDNINLFATMTVFALLILAPVAFLLEGIPLATVAALPSATGMPLSQLWTMLAMGGVCRCVDVLTSYMILQRVSPVTHSVGNCVKRAVVIAVSIVFFKTPMTLLTALGTCLALAGVLLYSLIVAGCKQNTFGPDSPMCRPVYDKELELVEGGGI